MLRSLGVPPEVHSSGETPLKPAAGTAALHATHEGFGVQWQSEVATPLSDDGQRSQSGVALRLPPQSTLERAVSGTLSGSVCRSLRLIKWVVAVWCEWEKVSLNGLRILAHLPPLA